MGTARKIGLDEGEKFPLDIFEGIALFGDGKAHHLEGGAAEDGAQLFHVLRISAARPKPLGNGGDDLLLHGPVWEQAHHQSHGVKRIVDAVDDAVVKGVGGNDTAFYQPLLQKPLLEGGNKAPEDVSCPKVDPGGGFFCLCRHLFPVEGGQRHPGLFPGSLILNALIVQFHGAPPQPFPASRSSISQQPHMYMIPKARS